MKAVPKEHNLKRMPEMVENYSKTDHLELWAARGTKWWKMVPKSFGTLCGPWPEMVENCTKTTHLELWTARGPKWTKMQSKPIIWSSGRPVAQNGRKSSKTDHLEVWAARGPKLSKMVPNLTGILAPSGPFSDTLWAFWRRTNLKLKLSNPLHRN